MSDGMTETRAGRWRPSGARVAVITVGLLAGSVLTGSAASSPTPSAFVPITPCRLIDTRPDTQVGPRATPIAAQETYTATVRGANGACDIPTTATGVSMNVAIVNPTGNSFLTLFPADASNPGTANLNWVAGQAPTPNAVTAALSTDGKLAIFNYAGTVDIAADIVGYYTPGGGAQGPKGDTGPTGPTGAAGATGARGPAGRPNRISNGQIALEQWWQDPGRGASFPVGPIPFDVAFDGTGIWVAGYGSDTVAKYDAVTGALLVEHVFPADTQPARLAWDGTSIWVVNDGTAKVVKLNATTGAVLGEYTAGTGPADLVSDGTAIWVADGLGTGIYRFDQTTGARTGPFPVAAGPRSITFDGSYLWVTADGPTDVFKVDLNGSVVTSYDVGSSAWDIAFDGTSVWIPQSSFSAVVRIDVATGAVGGPYTTGTNPHGIAYDGTSIWVANFGTTTVSQLDPLTGAVIAEYGGFANPERLVFDGTSIWVANAGNATITRLSRT